MDEKVIVVLISTIVSGAIAWVISWSKVKSEIKKLRYDMNARTAQTIIGERLQAYADVYAVLQTYIKSIQRRGFEPAMARDSFSSIDEWQTKFGFLLSSETNTIFYTFLRKLKRITGASDQAIMDRVQDNDKRTEMVREAFALELALKNDLGIFSAEYFDPNLKIRSYQELGDILDKEKN
ncbi:MAG: hypothetical protein HWE27_13875 [Gammaproteobacteria bacterium]|nr:hypothetical protein [Gammaproteobacteria bacterium]